MCPGASRVQRVTDHSLSWEGPGSSVRQWMVVSLTPAQGTQDEPGEMRWDEKEQQRGAECAKYPGARGLGEGCPWPPEGPWTWR